MASRLKIVRKGSERWLSRLVAQRRAISRTLLKNVLVRDGPPLRSTGVPNGSTELAEVLFGVSPLRCQFTDEKAPNKLGIPTGGSFFNRIIPSERLLGGSDHV